MTIVKCEFLWTRICPLKCHYCKMADGRRNTMSLTEIQDAIKVLKALDCKFIAFYGAEPLADFDKLPETVGFAERLGIHTTVITSGVANEFFLKLRDLAANGAKSLTMSYDMDNIGKASLVKSKLALQGLEYFRSLTEVRDVAVVATLTRKNYASLVATIKEMTEHGIWTFFDVIHWDRGQPGTKCGPFDRELVFREEDFAHLQQVLTEVSWLKKRGYLCHSSLEFIHRMSADNFALLKNYNWNCGCEDNFPAWLTMDCDGYVFPCDDFQPRDGRLFHISNLLDEFEDFKIYWAKEVVNRCPGCLWNTHIDAHLIKRGELPIDDYVHCSVEGG